MLAYRHTVTLTLVALAILVVVMEYERDDIIEIAGKAVLQVSNQPEMEVAVQRGEGEVVVLEALGQRLVQTDQLAHLLQPSGVGPLWKTLNGCGLHQRAHVRQI